MAKKNLKKQLITPSANVSFAILIPDYGTISKEELEKIKHSTAKYIFVLNNYKSDIEDNRLIDFSSTQASEIIANIENLEFSNVVHWGNSIATSYALDCAKRECENIELIGEKPGNSKDQKGKTGRILYELTTQIATNIPAYGSHTKTAVYPKEIFLDLLAKEDKKEFTKFVSLFSRAKSYGHKITSNGSFSKIRVENPIKKIIKSKLLFFTEKWNYFFTTPIKQLKTGDHNGGASHPIYKLLFFLIFITSLVILPILSQNYGATWDEKLHSDYGKEVVEAFPDEWLDEAFYENRQNIHSFQAMKAYSASFDVITAAVHKLFPSAGLYELRHLLNSFYGAFLFLFCGLIAKEFGGWRTGLIALLLVIFSPSFFGQIFNNPKDIPFATGFAMGVLYLIRYFKELPNPTLKTKIFLALGIALAISIRPPGFILIAFFGLVLFVHFLIFLPGNEKKKGFLKYLLAFISISAVAYILGISMWPFGLQDPISNPLEALRELSNFGQLTAYQIFEGVRQYLKPWYYIPKSILITAPLVMLLGIVFGFLGFVKLKGKKQKWLLVFLLFVTVSPVAYGIMKDSYLYNGWRHFLFIYTPLVAFAAIGFEMIIRMFKGKIGNYIAFGLLALGLGKIAFWQIQNHPYEYMYYNEIVGGTKGAAGDYETDYWCQTPKAAIEWLAKNELKGNKKVRVKTNNETNSLQYYANKHSDSIQIVWTREYEWQKDQWDYAIWTTRTLSKSQIENKATWPPKGTIHTIDVDGFPMAAIVKRANNYAMDGIDALEKQNYPLALAQLNKAYEYDPNEEEVVRRIGMAHKAMGDFSQAEKYLDKARVLRGENYEALEAMGEIRLAQSDRERQNGNEKGANQFKEEAKAFFIKTIEHKINFSAAYYYLGNIYLTDGNYIEAINNFDQFIEKQPTSPQGYLLKARAQIALNSFKEAEETLLTAINVYGLKDQQLFLLLADVYKQQGNAQAAQQVINQMPK